MNSEQTFNINELNDIEDLFVREVLDTHGEYIVDLLQESIESKKLRLTDGWRA